MPTAPSSFLARLFRRARRRFRPKERPWDREFKRWIREAQATGRDVNDLGDEAWRGAAEGWARSYYLPRVRPEDVVLELGPGTGRFTRHVIAHCRRMILVDYSTLVCEWLEGYLRGRGSFEVHCIDRPAFPFVADDSVDFAFACGVFEHLDADDALWFLEDFRRVLKPGSSFMFDFDNLMSDAGRVHLLAHRGRPGDRNIFRFYHPDALIRLAETAGLSLAELIVSDSRFGFLEVRKPAAQLSAPR
jgi:SAM-dependent methyltransferase